MLSFSAIDVLLILGGGSLVVITAQAIISYCRHNNHQHEAQSEPVVHNSPPEIPAPPADLHTIAQEIRDLQKARLQTQLMLLDRDGKIQRIEQTMGFRRRMR